MTSNTLEIEYSLSFLPEAYINTVGGESNGKPPHQFHFPGKQLRALSLVSAKLSIKYAKKVGISVFRGWNKA